MRDKRKAVGIIKGKVSSGGRGINKDEYGAWGMGINKVEYGAGGLGILKDKVVVEQQQQHMRDERGALSI